MSTREPDVEVILITKSQVEGLLSFPEVVEAVELAFRSVGEKTCIMPQKFPMFVDPPKNLNFLIAMPAYLRPLNIAGCKWCNLYFDQQPGIPTLWGLVILNDPLTGLPVALVDGTSVTNMRTAGHAAVAAKYLSKADSSTVAILGCGAEGRTHLQAMKAVRPSLKRVQLCDIRDEAMDSFIEDVRPRVDAEFVKTASPREAVRGTDIVCMTTTSNTPIVMHDWIEPGCFVAGAYSFNDLDPMLSKTADKWVLGSIESDEHRIIDHPGRPLSMPVSKSDVYGDMGQIVTGQKPGRQNDEERIVYTHLGMGPLDVAVAARAYEKAKARGIGETLRLN
ncbi:MAG: hypothetical protein HY675_27550 [Chloroflexi bacterium]|nr:hypothetical protein [Chloroflexota bacterium]